MSVNGKSYMNDFVESRITPYPQPWANAKHSASQVNGETQQTQHDIVLQNNVRKQRSK
ncbi:YpzG family protein [Bacillus sp. NPDC077027]|uniref:YpzG family protein n=1 Tax=Bacillus sp. NPDC077027 TaxID=3390548 RepID=UPI003CFC7C08